MIPYRVHLYLCQNQKSNVLATGIEGEQIMKRTVLAILVAAAALVTGCQVSTGSFSKQTPTVLIGRLNIVTGLPFLVAQQKAFLADEAIEYAEYNTFNTYVGEQTPIWVDDLIYD